MGWGFIQSWAIVVLYCPRTHTFTSIFTHTHMHGMHKKLSPITKTYLACCAIFFFGSFCSVFSDISSAIIFVFMAVIIAILPLRSGHINHIKLVRFQASFQLSCFQHGKWMQLNLVIQEEDTVWERPRRQCQRESTAWSISPYQQ